jgi:RND family efflux transporter MFP subunit
VTQGQYVNAGDTLFTVADLNQVWIKADVYEEQLPQIRQGQEVEITAESLPNRTLHGHVDFIEPAANPQTRTVPVHVHVANPQMRLLPGMFVNATFVSRAAEPSIVVPRSAVLDTGTRKIVYLARPNGVFEAREVQVGAATEDLVPGIERIGARRQGGAQRQLPHRLAGSPQLGNVGALRRLEGICSGTETESLQPLPRARMRRPAR